MNVKQSFRCPKCGRISHNPNDIREGYCGACHDWTGLDPEGDWTCGKCGGTIDDRNGFSHHPAYGEICYSCYFGTGGGATL